MFRVTSRQRLVSWDAFDASLNEDSDTIKGNNAIIRSSATDTHPLLLQLAAANPNDKEDGDKIHTSITRAVWIEPQEENDDDEGEWKGKEQGSSWDQHRASDRDKKVNNGKKRDRSSCHRPNGCRPILPCTTASSTTAACRHTRIRTDFCDLANELKIAILSFLTASELRAFSETNTSNLLLTRTHLVWFHLFANKWPRIFTPAAASSAIGITYTDDSSIPMAAYHKKATTPQQLLRVEEQEEEHSLVNLSVIHKLAQQPHPTCIDPNIMKMTTNSGFSSRNTKVSMYRTFYMRDKEEECNNNSVQVIQYTGVVGCGDRCIRSDQSFPHAIDDQRTTKRWCPQSIFDLLCRGGTSTLTLMDEGALALVVPSSGRSTNTSNSASTRFPSITSTPTTTTPENITSTQHPYHHPANIFFRSWNLCGITTLKPFVSPYVTHIQHKDPKTKNDMEQRRVNVSPRLFAYFEITIHERDESQEPSRIPPLAVGSSSISQEEVSQSQQQHRNTIRARRASWQRPTSTNSNNHQNNVENVSYGGNDDNTTNEEFGNDDDDGSAGLLFTTSSECVAIGLANEIFDWKKRMPGWDKNSYGYHGDDGGIFHGKGDMLRRFGPTYGVGDTVGCGIDYANQGIFFTINGQFLGYAWKHVNLQQPLRPTIGIDTHTPISCNFGERPFVFDVSTPFTTPQHRALIETAFSGFPNSASYDHHCNTITNKTNYGSTHFHSVTIRRFNPMNRSMFHPGSAR
jgi:hypothetical protein